MLTVILQREEKGRRPISRRHVAIQRRNPTTPSPAGVTTLLAGLLECLAHSGLRIYKFSTKVLNVWKLGAAEIVFLAMVTCWLFPVSLEPCVLKIYQRRISLGRSSIDPNLAEKMSKSPNWERIDNDYTFVHRKFKIKTRITTGGMSKMLIEFCR